MTAVETPSVEEPRKHRKKIVVLAVAGLMAFSSGLGLAYYNATIAATSLPGGATAAADATLPVQATLATAATGLVPGAPAQPLTVTLTNPNAYSVGVDGTLTLDVANLTSDQVGCTGAEALLTATAAVVNDVIAAGGTLTATFSVAMQDSPTVDQTVCAGATFTIPVLVS